MNENVTVRTVPLANLTNGVVIDKSYVTHSVSDVAEAIAELAPEFCERLVKAGAYLPIALPAVLGDSNMNYRTGYQPPYMGGVGIPPHAMQSYAIWVPSDDACLIIDVAGMPMYPVSNPSTGFDQFLNHINPKTQNRGRQGFVG